MGKFFKRKACIYLDQFAVSNLAEKTEWGEILILLREGVDNGKIIVPYSIEHLIETSQKDLERAQTADKILFDLSKGIGIETENVVSCKLLIGKVRKIPVNASTYCLKVPVRAFDDRTLFEHFSKKKQIFDKMTHEGFYSLNNLRGLMNEKQRQDFSELQKTIKIRAEIYQSELTTRFNKYSKYGFFDTKTIEFSFITIPFWADQVLNVLIKKFSLTRKEGRQLEIILKEKGIRHIIPNLYIRVALETILSLKQQKEKPNDHIDIMRLCTAIPFADIILTDKSKEYDIKTIGLDTEFKTEIFSGTFEGVMKFKEKLSQIIGKTYNDK